MAQLKERFGSRLQMVPVIDQTSSGQAHQP
jgi:hypothetical protein